MQTKKYVRCLAYRNAAYVMLTLTVKNVFSMESNVSAAGAAPPAALLSNVTAPALPVGADCFLASTFKTRPGSDSASSTNPVITGHDKKVQPPVVTTVPAKVNIKPKTGSLRSSSAVGSNFESNLIDHLAIRVDRTCRIAASSSAER